MHPLCLACNDFDRIEPDLRCRLSRELRQTKQLSRGLGSGFRQSCLSGCHSTIKSVNLSHPLRTSKSFLPRPTYIQVVGNAIADARSFAHGEYNSLRIGEGNHEGPSVDRRSFDSGVCSTSECSSSSSRGAR